jgi:hypothetical protein
MEIMSHVPHKCREKAITDVHLIVRYYNIYVSYLNCGLVSYIREDAAVVFVPQRLNDELTRQTSSLQEKFLSS